MSRIYARDNRSCLFYKQNNHNEHLAHRVHDVRFMIKAIIMNISFYTLFVRIINILVN